ncbi:hypothetical protein PMAYCL1PPCAC_21282, partial [Pristionchus mayeri]
AVFVKIYEDTTLANLPPEMIRKIIQMEKDYFAYSTSGLKTISRAWNNMVVELQNDNRLKEKLPTIERVYLSACVPVDDWRVEMYALLHQRFSGNVGVGEENGWLRRKTNTDYEEGVFEVESAQWEIATRNNPRIVILGVGFGLFSVAASICIFVPLNGGLLLLLAIFGMAVGALVIKQRYGDFGKEEDNARERFARFIDTFTHIGTLVLEDLGCSVNQKPLSAAVLKMLGKVRINALEIREDDFNEIVRERIVKICHKHGVRYVLIAARKTTEPDYLDFLLDLCDKGIIVDIYQKDKKMAYHQFANFTSKNENRKVLSLVVTK